MSLLGFLSMRKRNFFHPEEVADGEEFPAAQQVEESIYTDDPVRVYLREMGAVPLLTREGEVNLARRMERGKLRMQKSISRSALVQMMLVEIRRAIKRGEVEIGDSGRLRRCRRRHSGTAKRQAEVRQSSMTFIGALQEAAADG